MLYRKRWKISDASSDKKKNDENHDKWIGVGGKFEPGESPDECLIREVKEETGLTLTKYQFRGIVTFCLERLLSDDPQFFSLKVVYEGEHLAKWTFY